MMLFSEEHRPGGIGRVDAPAIVATSWNHHQLMRRVEL